jgi:hypothetical protein
MLLDREERHVADSRLLVPSCPRCGRVLAAGDAGKNLFGLVPRLIRSEGPMSPERQWTRRKAAPPASAVLDEVGGGAVGVLAHAKSDELVIADDAPNILAP